jgi:hypothetical protein
MHVCILLCLIGGSKDGATATTLSPEMTAIEEDARPLAILRVKSCIFFCNKAFRHTGAILKKGRQGRESLRSRGDLVIAERFVWIVESLEPHRLHTFPLKRSRAHGVWRTCLYAADMIS